VEGGAKVSVDGQMNHVILRGDLDIASSDEIRAFLRKQLQPAGSVTADMEALTFIDSTGVRLLLDIVHAGFRLELVSVPPQAMHVFEMLGLTDRAGITIVPLET
jgi:anti-anti-sigma factor